MQETLFPYKAALNRPVVKASEAGDNLDAGDTVPYRVALYRPVVSPAKKQLRMQYKQLRLQEQLKYQRLREQRR